MCWHTLLNVIKLSSWRTEAAFLGILPCPWTYNKLRKPSSLHLTAGLCLFAVRSRMKSVCSFKRRYCCKRSAVSLPGDILLYVVSWGTKWIKRDFCSRSPLYRLCRWSFNNFIYTSVLEFGLYILITNRLTKTLLLKYVENPLFERASSKPTWRRQYVWTHASVHPHPPDSGT